MSTVCGMNVMFLSGGVAAQEAGLDEHLQVELLGAESALPGTEMRYELSVTNTGSSRVADIVVTDQLPDGVTSAGASLSNGPCESSPGSTDQVVRRRVVCAVQALGADQTVRMILTVQIDPNATGELANTATVTAAGSAPMTTPTVVTELIPRSELEIDVSVSSSAVASGGTVDYSVALSNVGPSTAADVELVTHLPGGFTSGTQHVSISRGTCRVGNHIEGAKVTCEIGSLAALQSTDRSGQSVTLTIRAQLSPSLGTGLVNTTATAFSSTALRPANDDVSVEVLVPRDLPETGSAATAQLALAALCVIVGVALRRARSCI